MENRLELSKQCIAAFKIALKYHSEQEDKSGMTYFWHPLRVANNMKGWKLQTIAILHDILEDTPETIDTLKKQGVTDKEVLDAIICITKKHGEAYSDYLKRVKSNKMARLVKLADIDDNMSVERLSHMPIHLCLKMVVKYWIAMRYLRDIDDESVCEKVDFRSVIEKIHSTFK